MTPKDRRGAGDDARGRAAPFSGGRPPGFDPQTALAAAVRHHRAGRLGEAQAIYRRLLEVQPENPDALSMMGLLAHQGGRDDIALDLLHKALTLRPDFAEAHVNLGNVLSEQGKLEKAVDHFEKAVSLKPGFAGARNNLGLALQELGRLDEAVGHFEKALLIDSRFADAHNNLGLTLQKQGKLEEAIRRYRKALALDPRFAEAHNNLGTALGERGEVDAALDCYRAAIAIRPNYVEARINLGLALQERNRPEEAVEQYRKALEVRPEAAELHDALGTAYYEQGRLDAAIEHHEKAVALEPGYVGAWVNLGNAFRGQGKFGEAAGCFGKVVSLRPDHAQAHVDLGVALHDQGDPAAALEHYEKALSIDPDCAHAFRDMGLALLQLGRHDDAQSAFDNLVRVRHGGPWWNAESFAAAETEAAKTQASPRAPRASAFKLRDTIDQLEYLLAKDRIDSSFEEMVDRYRSVLDEFERTGGADEEGRALAADQIERIGSFYNRVVHCAEAPRIAAGAVNDELDFERIEEDVLSSWPITYIPFDNFLTPEALRALRDFCLESTIFFSYSGNRFVGADASCGFNCGLLYQIAEEIKARVPRVLGGHALTNVWVYRHCNESEGVGVHTDQGVVTLNMWITPDAANLDPEHGGLVVYCKEQSYDVDWQLYNTYKYTPEILQEMEDYLATAQTIVVPHRQNRADLHNSNVFHRSDVIRFKDGFENRRMNVTMLFGKRGAGEG